MNKTAHGILLKSFRFSTLESKVVEVLREGGAGVVAARIAAGDDGHFAAQNPGSDHPCPYSFSSISKTSKYLISNVFSIFMLTFVWFLLLPALLPEKTSACACCASWGDWYEYKKQLLEFESDTLNQLKLSAKARLFLSDVEAKGISMKSADDDFTLRLSRNRSKWIMAFQNQKGEKGTLTLSLPQTATVFGTDPHDGKLGGAGGPVLYKEVRLEGRASGTGIFAKGIKPDTRFRLVLQGRGNRCLDSEDFNNWVLQVYGRQTNFGFYGTMDKNTSQ